MLAWITLLYLVISAVSICCSLTVVVSVSVMFVLSRCCQSGQSSKKVAHHHTTNALPSRLLFFDSLSDLFFTSRYMISYILKLLYPSTFDQSILFHPIPCYISAALGNFFGLASVSWNAVISISLFLMLRNPFVDPGKKNDKFYHLYVWSVSAISTVFVLAIPGNVSLTEDGTCWITMESTFFAMFSRSMFFFLIIIYEIVSITVLIYSLRMLLRGLHQSKSKRFGLLYRMICYNGLFAVCWIAPTFMHIFDLGYRYLPANNFLDIIHDIIGFLAELGTAAQAIGNVIVFYSGDMHLPQGLAFSRRHGPLNAQLLDDDQTNSTNRQVNDKAGDPGQIQNIDSLMRREIIHFIYLAINESVTRTDIEQPANLHVPWHCDVAEFERAMKYRRLFKREKGVSINFVDYAPRVFKQLRHLNGLSGRNYAASFDAERILDRLVNENFSEGKSGSFFCRTLDERFVIKTISKSELRVLLKILPSYYHYNLHNSHTLLTQFLGCHQISMYGIVIRFVVMNNVFDAVAIENRLCNKTDSHAESHRIRIIDRYDLKGSWISRQNISNRVRRNVNLVDETEGETIASTLGLDEDLKQYIMLGNEAFRRRLLRQLASDANFLASIGIMDYSLLLGISCRVKQPPSPKPNDQTSLSPAPPPQTDDTPPQDPSGAQQVEFDTADTNLRNYGRRRYTLFDSSGRDEVTVEDIDLDEDEEARQHIASSQDKRKMWDENWDQETFVPFFKKDSGGILSGTGERYFYIGIIDMLQEYTLSKKLEHLFKVYAKCRPKDGISSIPPEHYATRFQHKMRKVFQCSETTTSFRAATAISLGAALGKQLPLLSSRDFVNTETEESRDSDGLVDDSMTIER